MKKLLFLLLIVSSSYAQNNSKWADSAAVWHHTYNLSGVVPGYQKSSYVLDTIIQNKLCQKIYSEYQRSWPQPFNSPSILSPISFLSNRFLHKSNDSIFIFQNNSFRLAFKINAFAGEIWDLGQFYSGEEHTYVKVDSVYFQNYNGISLRNIIVTPCKANGDSVQYFINSSDTNDTYYISNLTIINEKMGPINGFYGSLSGHPNEFIYEVQPQFLLCYESAVFPFYSENGTNCFNGILTGANELKKNYKISIYPNPVNNLLTIDLAATTDVSQVIVYSSKGDLILTQNILGEKLAKINTTNLANGSYTLQIIDKKGNSIKTEMLIINHN